MTGRLIVRSFHDNELIDDIENRFRVPLRRHSIKLICHRRPSNIRYKAQYPFLFTIATSVMASVAATYLVALINYLVKRVRSDQIRPVLFVVTFQDKKKSFRIPSEAGKAKRLLRTLSKSKRCKKQLKGGRKVRMRSEEARKGTKRRLR